MPSFLRACYWYKSRVRLIHRWPYIQVEVKASEPVETTQSLKEEANGFQRLAITLSNEGTHPAKNAPMYTLPVFTACDLLSNVLQRTINIVAIMYISV
jgi:hypothetical protein